MASAPSIFGIVNVTSDSFSDGGKFLNTAAAIEHALQLTKDGADVIDLGAVASNPDADAVPAAEEIRRLAPIVAALHERDVTVSVDTFSSETQAWALAQRVAWLNDIQGFGDPALYPALAEARCKLVLMHNVVEGKAQRVETDASTIMDRLYAFFDRRLGALTGAGVPAERIVLDPGMGFFLGNDPNVSLEVLRRLPEIKARYGLPLLVSVSRKSFLRKLAGVEVEHAGPATLAGELFAALNGADFIRTHDVAALKQGLTVWKALNSGR
ncbi:MAG: dihydropteroate synthase [Alphaproteobacteria bacterium]|nr:dihydropteroate synthase [Alphaproteobacteria bacterium]